jgi:hypothetical protein
MNNNSKCTVLLRGNPLVQQDNDADNNEDNHNDMVDPYYHIPLHYSMDHSYVSYLFSLRHLRGFFPFFPSKIPFRLILPQSHPFSATKTVA